MTNIIFRADILFNIFDIFSGVTNENKFGKYLDYEFDTLSKSFNTMRRDRPDNFKYFLNNQLIEAQLLRDEVAINNLEISAYRLNIESTNVKVLTFIKFRLQQLIAIIRRLLYEDIDVN